MKQAQQQSQRRLTFPLLGLAIVIAALAPFSAQIRALAGDASVHPPRWDLWAGLAPALKIHIIAALSALVIGTVLMLRPKGRAVHKTLGWIWVGAMSVTALSSFFLTGLNGDAFSLIHILSGWTMVALPMGIYAIRRRNVENHRRTMTGLYFGGLIVAGALTFLPGRLMFAMFFG